MEHIVTGLSLFSLLSTDSDSDLTSTLDRRDKPSLPLTVSWSPSQPVFLSASLQQRGRNQFSSAPLHLAACAECCSPQQKSAAPPSYLLPVVGGTTQQELFSSDVTQPEKAAVATEHRTALTDRAQTTLTLTSLNLVGQ